MKKTCFLGLILALICVGCSFKKDLSDLRCEGLENPLGIDNAQPHFSWKITTKEPFAQTAYEIEVATDKNLLQSGKADLWTSGKVASDKSVMIPYGGQELAPRQLCYWRVRSYEGEKATEWSDIQRFSIGIIGPDQMKGKYIGMGMGENTTILLQKTFELTESHPTTFLHVNSLGYHEAYVNGQKVSDGVLAPAVSQMNKRSLILTYDISQLLKKGKNNIVLWIGSGWYKKSTFNAAFDGALVRADLDIQKDGQWNTFLQTDETWQGCESGYTDTKPWGPWAFGGEQIDASLVPSDLSLHGLKEREWKSVQVAQVDTIVATPQMCQLNTLQEAVTAVKVDSLGNDKWMVDMGKVLTGMVEFHLPSLPAGHQVQADYGDGLAEGNQKTNEISGSDIFIASGNKDGDTFRNRFNHHCFRYVLLSNLPIRPDQQQLKANRIALNATSTGTFDSSDKDLNAIHDMLSYTIRGLAFSGYMVDCAHIERLGYGGDGNASTLSVHNLFDAAPMYMNWLQAWNDVIQPDGGLPHTAPEPYPAGGGPYWCTFIVQAPWRTWMDYGDDRLLHRCYDNMKKWLGYVDAHTVDGLLRQWPDTDYRGWYLGDWVPPTGIDPTDTESVDLVNNCALCQSYNELIQIAEYLNKPQDKAEFTQRREALGTRIHQTFYHPDENKYGTGSQIDMIYPMLVGACPDSISENVTNTLFQRTDTVYNGHMAVGLVGVPVLAEWATLSRQADYLYNMLKQPDYPGYLYMLNNGATGTWEEWQNPRSRFHNCFNGMDSWFFQALGGIIPIEPGYKKTLIAPQMPKDLDWVTVTRETPYGPILVHWERTGSQITVHVELPNGINAIVNGNPVEPSQRIIDYSI